MKPVVIALLLAGSLVACSKGGAPASVVEEFARKMDSGSCDGLQDYLSSASRNTFGPKLEQACRLGNEMRKANPKDKTIRSMTVVESKEEGDRATVRMSAEYSDGSQDKGDEAIHLVRENGQWKIDLLATGGLSGMGAGGPEAPGAGMTPPAAAPGQPPIITAPDNPATNAATTNEAADSENEG